jgi:hypothetical protein
MYGTQDYALDNAGVTAAVDRLLPAGNGDKMDSHVWWDK